MLGGPMVGVLVFLLIAVLLGWGLITVLGMQLDTTVQDAATAEVAHRFEPGTVYVLEQDLLLGVTTHADPSRAVVLFPDRDGLPRDAPHRGLVPTVADVIDHPARYPDVLGVVLAGTRVRFNRLMLDTHNRQTAYLAEVLILDGPFAEQTADLAVTGLHLEQAQTTETGGVLLVPREDLFRAETTTSDDDHPQAADESQPIQ